MKIELEVYWMKLNPSSPAISNSQTAKLGSKFIQWKDALLLSQSQRIWYWRITDIISFLLIWLFIRYFMKKGHKMCFEFSTTTMRLPHLAANWRLYLYISCVFSMLKKRVSSMKNSSLEREIHHLPVFFKKVFFQSVYCWKLN